MQGPTVQRRSVGPVTVSPWAEDTARALAWSQVRQAQTLDRSVANQLNGLAEARDGISVGQLRANSPQGRLPPRRVPMSQAVRSPVATQTMTGLSESRDAQSLAPKTPSPPVSALAGTVTSRMDRSMRERQHGASIAASLALVHEDQATSSSGMQGGCHQDLDQHDSEHRDLQDALMRHRQGRSALRSYANVCNAEHHSRRAAQHDFVAPKQVSSASSRLDMTAHAPYFAPLPWRVVSPVRGAAFRHTMCLLVKATRSLHTIFTQFCCGHDGLPT
jgi:hypothetical protein